MLCVSFSSKLEAITDFWKHILKSEAHDQSIQASKKWFYHIIIKNYLCNVSWRFLIKIESTWRYKMLEQAPPPIWSKSKACEGVKSYNRHPHLTLLYHGRTVRSSHRRCCIRKPFLKILQYLQETTVLEYIFKNVAGL